jgi:hypothetical protein
MSFVLISIGIKNKYFHKIRIFQVKLNFEKIKFTFFPIFFLFTF